MNASDRRFVLVLVLASIAALLFVASALSRCGGRS